MDYKIIIIGESQVGKTTLLNRYIKGKYEQTVPTEVIDNIIKESSIVVDGQTLKMKTHFWDTAGTEKFKALSAMYYKNVDAVILVYAINDLNSFKELEAWETEIKRKMNGDPVVFILGNKVDLADQQRAVEMEQIDRFADGRYWQETSALAENSNIDQIMMDL